MTQSNQTRAKRCGEVLSAYSTDDTFTNLIDLLTDAMHWCDFTGQDFHITLAQACRHYINELNDDQHDERRHP